MTWHIGSPYPPDTVFGNRITAERWRRILTRLGLRVEVIRSDDDPLPAIRQSDGLVALHARRSADLIRWYHFKFPDRPLVVAMTGTDLHGDFQRKGSPEYELCRESVQLADRLILLEPKSLELLPKSLHKKARVIFQSAEPAPRRGQPIDDAFEVSVIGHLRPEKDPLLAARAAQLLPPGSRVRIVHIGFALDEACGEQARQESKFNPRYRWLGGMPHAQALYWLTRSRLTALTSRSEGGPSVIAEAAVNDVPVVSTAIFAAQGMLGDDYPGFFPVGDAQALADLLYRAETVPAFLSQLKEAVRQRAALFSPEREIAAWQSLLQELAHERSG